jgi:hypothetical protein
MILGGYKFRQNPDSMPLIHPRRSTAGAKTYTSYAFFSWGFFTVGQTITLKWATMMQAMYDELLALYVAGNQVVFDPKKEDESTYTCEIIDLSGTFYLSYDHDFALRKDVTLSLLILSES